MYILKENVKIAMNQRTLAQIIGIHEVTLSNIMKRKVSCRKVVALCIVHYIDKDAELLDYFDKVEED